MPLPDPAPNHPVERTAHSAGSVSIRGTILVGRRSFGPFGFDFPLSPAYDSAPLIPYF